MDAAADDYQKIFLSDLLNRLLRHTASRCVTFHTGHNDKRPPRSATALDLMNLVEPKRESFVQSDVTPEIIALSAGGVPATSGSL